MILIVDNFDSFTYNIVQYFYELNQAVIVWHNDQATLQAIAQLNPDYIVISPGPCTPNEAGISLAVIEHFAGKIPILGVCLGMQAIGQAFGGQVVRAKKVMHGRVSRICHDGTDLFAKLPSPMRVTRYHSLVVEQASLPDCLQITAYTDDGLAEIMAIRHRTLPVVGVQFHPEAILSEHGHAIFQNFLTEFEKINQ